MPGPYKFDDPWSSWLWLDADHVFELLGFDGKYDLSPGMKQIRNWFIARLVEHLGRSNLHILSLAGRRIAHTQVFDKARKYIESEGIQLRDAILPTNFHEAVYGKIYQV